MRFFLTFAVVGFVISQTEAAACSWDPSAVVSYSNANGCTYDYTIPAKTKWEFALSANSDGPLTVGSSSCAAGGTLVYPVEFSDTDTTITVSVTAGVTYYLTINRDYATQPDGAYTLASSVLIGIALAASQLF